MKKMESILKKIEDDLYMNAPYGYLSIASDGTIKKVNNLILNWTGYNAEEILNTSIQHLLLKEKIETETQSAKSYEGTYRLRSRGDTNTKVSIDVVDLKEAKDKDVVLRVVLQDNSLTDKKTFPKNIETSYSRLHKNKNTLRSKSVTHEIQTPLSIIKGAIDLLDETVLTHQQKEYLEILKNSSEVLRNVMTEVIDFNSLENTFILKEENIDVKKFINGIFKMHSIIVLKKNLDLKLIVGDKIPDQVYGDKTKIAQILLNLLNNAVKFTKQGSVTLEVHHQQVSYEGVTLLFKVSDTGIGIDQKEIKNIFHEYAQANDKIKDEYGGLGLGLFICKNILSLYGSELQVRSSSLGSEFSFSLTLPLGKNTESSNKDLSTELKDITVLIADDNNTNALITSHYLKQLGIQFETACDGESAYQKVLEGKFDLVLMDMQMPVTNGIDATKKIRSIQNEQLKATPIIAFSADCSLTKNQLAKIGINDFLLKPFNADELYQVITSNIPKIKIENLPTETTASINLDILQKLTQGDPEELNILLKKLIEDFEECKRTLEKAFEIKDLTTIKAVFHKLKSQIHYLKAFKLEQAMNDAIVILNNPSTQNKTSEILKDITNELDKSIQLMRDR